MRNVDQGRLAGPCFQSCKTRSLRRKKDRLGHEVRFLSGLWPIPSCARWAGGRCARQFATRTGALGTFPSMAGVGRLSGIALECPDPARLAHFYSRLTGWPVVYSNPDWYSVGESERAEFYLSFQRSPGHRPPTWPDPASSMQLHLHFRVNDLDEAERTVLLLAGRSSITSLSPND